MRVKHTLFNVTAGVGSQLLITALSFVTRTVFIHSLGIEYLGISGLFTSLLAMLSLAEAGIGSSIVYNLYKPVAEQDEPKMIALMQLYRRAYAIICGVVVALGLAMMPFLNLFIQETNVEHLYIIYLLFLINTAAPYLYVYKHSFLNVNQKNYIITMIFTGSTVLTTGLKIAILLWTENYLLFLAIEGMMTIITSFYIAKLVDRRYPFINSKQKMPLDEETKRSLLRNMKAIILQNIGVYFIFGVDNILISTYVSIAAVGLYANYNMLIEICRTFAYQVSNNTYHSVGNLVAKESAGKIYDIYKVAALLNFWLYSLFGIMLLIVTEPFITLWIGSQYVLGKAILVILVLAFYERGMRNAITTVKTTAGIFHADRYAPLCQAAINLGVSIALVYYLGLLGIFIGTLISALAVPFWFTPLLVYRRVFKQPLWHYFWQYTYYTFIAAAAYGLSSLACTLVHGPSLYALVLQGAICFIVVNALYMLVFLKSAEFSYLKQVIRSLALKYKFAP